MVTEAEIQHQAELSAKHEKLTQFAKWHLCAECGGILVVVWNGKDDDYQLKCGRNKAHIGTKSWRDTPAQKERDAKQMLVDNIGTEKGMALEPYTKKAALLKAEAEIVIKTIWPKAPQVEIIKAAHICQDYGLNPLMKHLFLVPFNEGKPNESWAVILSIHATRLLARRRGNFTYVDDTPRIMNELEQKRRFGEVDNKNYWAITKIRDSYGNEAPGYGNWPKDKAAYGADKGNTPQKMAFIRSERDALDRLFPGELPALEVAEARYVEVPIIVNSKTGEINLPISSKTDMIASGSSITQDGPLPPALAIVSPAKPNGAEDKATPAQHRAIEAAALRKGYAYPQGVEGQLAQHKGYPGKLGDLTITQANNVLDWLKGEGLL